MTVTVLKLSDADAYLKNISIRSIKDVRALDVDLMLVLVNGDRIIISSGAVTSESKGQTTSVQNLTLGYYWVAQKLENAKGGPGDDEILVGTTKDRQATVIETGSGRDTVTVGKFGTAATNLEATISDFQLEMDKVKVFLRDGGHKMNYQNITSANWQQFAPRAEQSAFGSGTKLVIDLDGAGAGTDKYTLYLPTVAFNYDTNTKSLFGL
ncbi:UNVERIFIED_ORG: hypothetical protein DFO49_4551 [Herbaspirillum seropedicae]|jgi:hypothetical protein